MITGHGVPHDLSKTSVWLHGYGAAHEAAYQASYQMWNAHSNIHGFKPTIVNCKSGVIVLFFYGSGAEHCAGSLGCYKGERGRGQ